MSKQYPGGLITKSPVVPSGPYQTSTASGIWTLEQQAYWQKLGQWPTAGNLPIDPQFNYVTMLLHGDGTNGAQNNTFLDSSTNNFTITRNGNTTQGSFSPYGSNWSNYFNGTTDYLSSTVTSLSGQFTIEFMYYSTTSGTNYGMTFGDSNTSTGLEIYQSGGVIKVYSNNAFQITGTSGSSNSWIYVALTRDGSNNIKLYVNGAQQGSTWVSSATFSSTLRIGVEYYSAAITGYLSGYISNFRILNVTSTPTVPTAPLTAISGTTFLTCQSNRFIDNSANNYTITTTGTPSVQRFNPFGTSTAYSTSVIGGSGYFDGTGDYLSTPNSSSFAFGTGNFTVEFWYRGTDTGGGFGLTTGGSTGYWQLNLSGGTMYWQNDVGVSNLLSVSASPILNDAWNHVAVVRNSTTLTIYFNGVSVTSTSDTTNYSGTGGNFQLGFDSNSAYIAGYIADYRIVKGTAVYTANFTPPTAPLTAITNTSLLLSMTNGAIFDNAMMNDLETVGNAQISTSVVKYGTGSIAFDGTGDFLQAPLIASNGLGGGDFTVEMWVYMNNITGIQVFYAENTDGGGPTFYSNAGTLVWYYGSNLSSGAAISAGAWTHIAACRASGTLRFFINGTQTPTSHSTSTDYPAKILRIGSSYYSEAMNGYIDDLRITKGYARYTTTFTPPTAAFFNIGPT